MKKTIDDSIKLRPWKMDDLDNLLKYADNDAIARNMTDQFPHPYTATKAKAFIENAAASNPVNIFAIELNGQAVGAIGIHPQSDIQKKNAEMGYWLAEPFWGRGIITTAIRMMTEYAFSTWDICRIFARPFGNNIASQKALEKAGFKLEGRFEKTFYKNGEFVDELVYAIRK